MAGKTQGNELQREDMSRMESGAGNSERLLYSVQDLHRMTGLSVTYLYGVAHRVAGYQPLRDPCKPGRHRIVRFRRADVDFALQTGKPLIAEPERETMYGRGRR